MRVLTLLGYLAIPLAFVRWWIACAIYVIVAAMWLVPDRRFEHREDPHTQGSRTRA